MRKFKSIISIILVLVMAFSALGVIAAAADTIDVEQGINLKVNGRLYKPTDAAGKEVDVFIYKGTTYVPVRALTKVLGATIEWDSINRHVLISVTGKEKLTHDGIAQTEKTQSNATISVDTSIKIFVNGEAWTPTDANGKEVSPMLSGGTTYVPLRAIAEMLNIKVGWEQSTKTVLLGDSTDIGDLTDSQKEVQSYLSKIDEALLKLESDYNYLNTMYNNYVKIANYGNSMKLMFLYYNANISTEHLAYIQTYITEAETFKKKISEVSNPYALDLLQTDRAACTLAITTVKEAAEIYNSAVALYDSTQAMIEEIKDADPYAVAELLGALGQYYGVGGKLVLTTA